MPQKLLSVEQALAILADTPKRIVAATTGVEAARLQLAPSVDEWSANEVLAHLRSCADVWGGCMGLVLAQNLPTIRAVNPRTWIKSTDYPEQRFEASLASFVAQRLELLRLLEGLTAEGWSREATVTGEGKPRRRTVLSYADRLARHERPHVKQIERAVRTVQAVRVG